MNRRRKDTTRAPSPSMAASADSIMLNEPLIAVRAGLSLVGRLWGLMPMSTEDRAVSPVVSAAIGTFNAAVFGAMLFGLWRLTRDEWPRWWPLPVLLVSFTLVHSLYWADMRMRAPLVPAIALLAARAFCGRHLSSSAFRPASSFASLASQRSGSSLKAAAQPEQQTG